MTTTLPAGWKLVPAVMTLEMSVAFAEVWYSKRRAIDDDDMQDAYAAMLAAAPTPPATTQDDPITVSLDPDPRGVSVGVWQGSRCIYNGAHAVPVSAQDDAKDEQAAFEAWGLAGCEMADDPRSMRFAIARHCAWEAWKARAAVAAPAAGDALDVLLLTQALQELRQAFVIAVGDKSPFARIALEKADAAIAASQQQEG